MKKILATKLIFKTYMYLKYNKKEFKLDGLNGYRYKKKYFNQKYEVFFFGSFRTPIEEIEVIIFGFKNHNFNKINIEKIFRNILGICTLVIINDDEIKIAASILHPCIRIFETGENIIFTDNEFDKNKKLSFNNSFLKLFSHHSYFFHHGIYDDVKDFLFPGSLIKINKKFKDIYDFSWYLNFNEICSRDDHSHVAEELAESYVSNFRYLDSNKQNFLSLSGGMDSALLLASSQKYIDLQPVHIGRGIYSDELDTAKKVAENFNKKLTVKYAYNLKYSTLNFNHNILDELEYNFKFVKNNDNLFFPLHNGDIFLKHFLPANSNLINGDGDPLLLTIDQHLKYPDRINKDFDHEIYKNKRYFYSLDFFKNQMNKKSFDDEFNIYSEFPQIDPYYYPVINSSIDQLSKLYDYRNRYLNSDKSFNTVQSSPITNLSAHQFFLFKKLRKKNAFLILKKIVKSEYFNEKLKNRDPIVAQQLLKFFMFLGPAGKDIHQSSSLSKGSSNIEAIALNANIVIKQLSTVIDEKLVKYSKWHIFKAFQKIAGKNFLDLYSRPSLKNPEYVFRRICSKTFSKINSIPEHDDKYALINNKSFNKFIENNKIKKSYQEFKSEHIFRDLLYEFPTNNERLTLNDLNSNFWKLNNIINIVAHL